VFLLDGEGRVRWKGCGQPNEEEAKALPMLYQQLLHEHLQQQQQQQQQAREAAK
jgi:hypothetical protein